MFIEFTLSAILDIIKAQEKHQVEHRDKHQVEHRDKHQVEHRDKHQVEHRDKHQVEHEDKRRAESDTHFKILKALEAGSLSRREIFAAIGMSGDTRSFNRNLAPLLSAGLVEMTVPDKPIPANENIFRVCAVFLPQCCVRLDLTYRYEYATVNPSLPYGKNPRAYTENVSVRGYNSRLQKYRLTAKGGTAIKKKKEIVFQER